MAAGDGLFAGFCEANRRRGLTRRLGRHTGTVMRVAVSAHQVVSCLDVVASPFRWGAQSVRRNKRSSTSNLTHEHANPDGTRNHQSQRLVKDHLKVKLNFPASDAPVTPFLQVFDYLISASVNTSQKHVPQVVQWFAAHIANYQLPPETATEGGTEMIPTLPSPLFSNIGGASGREL
jgi:hypothetical protein